MQFDPEYKALLSAQRMLLADIQNPDTKAKDRAACARVLCSVIDQKRVKRMKPKPRDVDVSKMSPRKRPTATDAQPFVEAPRTTTAEQGISFPTQTVTTPPTPDGALAGAVVSDNTHTQSLRSLDNSVPTVENPSKESPVIQDSFKPIAEV